MCVCVCVYIYIFINNHNTYGIQSYHIISKKIIMNIFSATKQAVNTYSCINHLVCSASDFNVSVSVPLFMSYCIALYTMNCKYVHLDF